MAASGLPNACLTLTIRRSETQSAQEQYSRLHAAWKALVKRILRQFAKPPNQRWKLLSEDGYEYYDIQTFLITSQVKEKKIKRLHYMAFCEETENGEPHLHILLRSKFIPQKWLSQQMDELIQSPIIWIEKIKGPKSAIQYVTKYVTKAPAQFGKSRRYWTSRFYRIVTKEKPERPLLDRRTSHRVRQGFRELILEILNKGIVPIPQAREEVRLYSLSNAWKLFRNGNEWGDNPKLLSASLWLAHWRRQTGLVRSEPG